MIEKRQLQPTSGGRKTYSRQRRKQNETAPYLPYFAIRIAVADGQTKSIGTQTMLRIDEMSQHSDQQQHASQQGADATLSDDEGPLIFQGYMEALRRGRAGQPGGGVSRKGEGEMPRNFPEIIGLGDDDQGHKIIQVMLSNLTDLEMGSISNTLSLGDTEIPDNISG